jgi:two-component sensor histidine kinase
VPLLGDDGQIVEWFGAASDITDRKRAEEHQAMLMGELDHRVKNILAVVQSIARQSLGRDGGSGGPDAADRLTGRLAALARSHTLLADSRWEGAGFAELVESAVAPYRGEDAARVRTEGPDLKVTPKAAQTLTLALHKLVTNAAKYGALSGQAGRVDVAWEFVGPGDGGRLVFRWAEHGGPPIEGPPSRKGFGSRLLERALSFELAGAVTLEYARDGFKAVFDLPLETVGVDGRRHRRAANRASAP